ncbi:hypothetical protein CR513_40713, partial [Mucuna pruriens]
MGQLRRVREWIFAAKKKKRRERKRERKKCIFLSLLCISSNPCLMKNGTLSINKYFKEGTSLSNHLNEFQKWHQFEDKILELLLLKSLLETWETFKVFVTNSTHNSVVSLQMAKDSVLNEEIRRKAQGSSSRSEENKGKKGKSIEKDHDDDDDDRVTIATSDDLVILQDLSRLILYPMRAFELLITVLHCMLHQGRSFLHLTPQMILEC